MLLMPASMMIMLVGIMTMESVLSPGPTIPNPVHQTVDAPLQEERQYTVQLTPRVVTLFVYPKDADRLARTLEVDVSRHGGWTMSNENNRDLTFAVSEEYLERIEPLIEASGTQQVGAAYNQWATTVVPNPNPQLHRARPDTAIRINLRFPLTANPATLPMMAVTGGTIVAAFLALLSCAIVHQCTKSTA